MIPNMIRAVNGILPDETPLIEKSFEICAA